MQAQDSTEPTGIAGKPSGRDVPGNSVSRARNRKANAAIQLVVAGATWGEVAEVCGYPTPRAAKVAVEKALERELRAADPKDKEKLRQMVGLRLDRMLRSVWPKAVDENNPEHLAAQREARATMAEYVKLFGLAAPSELVVHTPTHAEMQALVARILAHRTAAVEEADIFEGVEDAEIVDDSHALPA